MVCGDIFLGLLAILFPPVAVWIKCGLCSGDSLLNILLSCLGYLPGLIHAWYIIVKYPDEEYGGYEVIPEDGAGRSGRVTYYYVSREPLPPGSRLAAQPSPPSGAAGGGAAVGAPDAGRAQREQARQGQPLPQQVYRDEPEAHDGSAAAAAAADTSATPPTYAEAVRGDHKVQTD